MGNLNDLPDIAAKIGIELRNQYVLGYSPTNQERDGKYRRVKVKLIQPRGLASSEGLLAARILCAVSIAELSAAILVVLLVGPSLSAQETPCFAPTRAWSCCTPPSWTRTVSW